MMENKIKQKKEELSVLLKFLKDKKTKIYKMLKKDLEKQFKISGIKSTVIEDKYEDDDNETVDFKLTFLTDCPACIDVRLEKCSDAKYDKIFFSSSLYPICVSRDFPYIAREMERICKEKFPLSKGEVKCFRVNDEAIRKISKELFDAFCFLNEKWRHCEKVNMENEIKCLIKKKVFDLS